MFEGSANDYRLNYLMEHEILAAFDRPSCIKFVKPENADEMTEEEMGRIAPMIRISEMYYYVCEYLMDSDLNGAKTELQKLRNARNAKEALIANSPAELEDVIVNDARREFMCEGQLFYFYKRLGRKVVDESGNYTMTEKDFVLPLPDVELEFGNRLSELYKYKGMKSKILEFIILLGMGLVLCSCEKDLEKYSGTDYIRFVSVFEKDSVDYNFGLAGKTTTDRIGIEVKVTGEVLDYDREYKVKVNPASTVQEGVHFNIPAQNCKLRANRVTDTLWVEVMNTEELKAEKLYLQLDLVESAHFKLCFPESNSCKIYLTDRIVRPGWWDEWHETEGLGSYSETKYRLFIRISGTFDLENIAYPEKRAAILKFKYYLEEEAAQGRVIMDENNQPMQVKMVG